MSAEHISSSLIPLHPAHNNVLLSPLAKRRTLHLRLYRIREKIVCVEDEIAALGAVGTGALFEHPALDSLRQRLCGLQARAAEIETELRSTRH